MGDNAGRREVIMKRIGLLMFLLGALICLWAAHGSKCGVLLANPQSSAAHPPDFPPGGTAAPGEPPIIHPVQPHPPGDFEQPAERKGQKRRINATQAQQDARELSTLAAKVQGEVNQLSKNVLPKDLDQDLKRVQKLAKRLRGEIAP